LSYYGFLLKKTFKNPRNFIPLLLLLLGIIGLYILNITSGDLHSYTGTAKDAYSSQKEIKDYYIRELNSDTKYSQKDIQGFKDGLQDSTEQVKWNQQIIQLADQDKWSDALTNSIKILNRNIKINEEAGGNLFPSSYVKDMKNQIIVYQQLMPLNQEPDTTGYEKFGFNYVFRVMNSIFPLFFVLIISVFLVEIFLNTYKKGVNIETLLPSSFISTTIKKVLYSTVLSVSIYTVTLLISFILASAVSGKGSSQYPTLLYMYGLPETVPIWTIIVKMFSLQVLSILNIVLLIALVSFFAKNRLTTLLISLIITIGSSMAFKSIEALYKFVHLNPFTYFYSGDVVTGLMASETNNTHVTLINGFIYQGLLAIVLMTATFIVVQQKEKRQVLVKGSNVQSISK